MNCEAMEVSDASARCAPPAEMPVVPEGYKQTDVGMIPEDWDLRPLKEYFKFSNGINTDKAAYGHGTPFINVLEPITHSHIRTADITGKVKVSRLITKLYSIEYGDIVFNRTSETQAELGLAAVFIGTEPVVFGGFVIRAQPIKPVLDPIYSGYGLRGPAVRSQVIAKGQGAVRANIGQESLRGILTPIPSSEEQHAIATALSDVDTLLKALDRLIAKKRNIKQAAMQQLLTAQTRLPGFEGEWERLTLGDIVTFLSGGTPPRNNESYWKGDIPWISATTLRTFYIWRSDSSVTMEAVAAGSKMAPVGSTLLLVRGSALHNEILAGLVTKPVCFNQDVKALVPHSGVYGQFLTFLLHGRAEDLLKLVSSAGNTAGVLDTKLLKAFEIQLPPRDEQAAIATVLSDTDTEIQALEERRAKTAGLKQAMMQELLTGRTRLVEKSRDEALHG